MKQSRTFRFLFLFLFCQGLNINDNGSINVIWKNRVQLGCFYEWLLPLNPCKLPWVKIKSPKIINPYINPYGNHKQKEMCFVYFGMSMFHNTWNCHTTRLSLVTYDGFFPFFFLFSCWHKSKIQLQKNPQVTYDGSLIAQSNVDPSTWK